jgi:RHS repeat-associated protein
LNRLQRVKEISSGSVTLWQQEYEFDRWGNRKVHQTNTWGPSSGPLIPKPNFEVETAKNRLYAPGDMALSESLRAMQYDVAGNLKKDSYTGAGDREYDAENRMTKAWANGQWQYYSYNADGQRVRRKVVYGMDGELLAEYAVNGAVASPQKEYGYRNGQLLVTAAPALTNFALSTNGAVATASSIYNANYPTSATVDGDRKGLNWNNGGGWNDATAGAYPDWLQIDFNGSKTIDEIDVFTLQDNPASPVEPTETITFSAYGITAFDVQYWNGSSWVTVTGGSITGNNKVWRKFTFAAITTTKIRVLTNASPDGFCRLTEVEAWGAAGSANINWLVADQLGTPRMIFDKSGSLANVKRHDYLPFGEELFAGVGGRTTQNGYSGDTVRQKFTSKERDNEAGLDYFLSRYYSSTQGRFISIDPLGASAIVSDPQSFNRYTYVLNNPLKYIDPDGLDAKNPWADLTDKERELLAAKLTTVTGKDQMAAAQKAFNEKVTVLNKDGSVNEKLTGTNVASVQNFVGSLSGDNNVWSQITSIDRVSSTGNGLQSDIGFTVESRDAFIGALRGTKDAHGYNRFIYMGPVDEILGHVDGTRELGYGVTDPSMHIDRQGKGNFSAHWDPSSSLTKNTLKETMLDILPGGGARRIGGGLYHYAGRATTQAVKQHLKDQGLVPQH